MSGVGELLYFSGPGNEFGLENRKNDPQINLGAKQ